MPDTSLFTLFPLSSSLCLQATEALVTERNLGVRAEPPRHGFQEAPFPRPFRMSHGRAGGCDRARAARSRPAHGTRREGGRPQKALHQGFP